MTRLGERVRSVGAAMRPLRAGHGGLAVNRRAFRDVPDCIRVSSPEFGVGRDLPQRYTADGEGVSPPLAWEGVPAGAHSLMLLVEDPDAPLLFPLVHALALGLPADAGGGLEAGALPVRMRVPAHSGMFMGRNTLGTPGWIPPSPIPGHGAHRYAFQVFALASDPRPDWPPGRGYALRQARGNVLGKGTVFAAYERH